MSVFIMDPITITTYNLHGFNQGKVLLPSLCKCSDIILIQEHWLYPDELYKLDRTDDNFVSIATSAMQIKTVCGPRKGRPFGGVGVLLRKSIAASAKCVAKEDRFIALFVGDVLIVNV